MSKGWISIHRIIQESWVYKDALYLKIWIHMLLEAFHKEHTTLVAGNLEKIERGQFVFGRTEWSKILIIKEWKLQRAIKLFCDDGMIKVVKNSNKYTIYEITKYEIYQHQNHQHETLENEDIEELHHQQNHQQSISKPSAEHQQTISKSSHNNNDNNDNNSFLSSIYLGKNYPQYPQYPKYWDWLEKNNYQDSSAANLKWLHENASHYKRLLGDNHPETKNAIMMYQEKKAICSEEVIQKAMSII